MPTRRICIGRLTFPRAGIAGVPLFRRRAFRSPGYGRRHQYLKLRLSRVTAPHGQVPYMRFAESAHRRRGLPWTELCSEWPCASVSQNLPPCSGPAPPGKRPCSALCPAVDSTVDVGCIRHKKCRARSSMVEQRTHNPLVEGSNPSGPKLFVCRSVGVMVWIQPRSQAGV
jgi:hypothetical protein